MKTGIIYHSHSGITRNIAEKIHNSLAGSIIEVHPVQRYSSLSVIPKGCFRALKGASDTVTPSQIDVSEFDCIILGSPVWAGRQTPVMNGAVDALIHHQGKKVFIIITCNDQKSGQTAVASLSSRCIEKGLQVSGSIILDKKQAVGEGADSLVLSQLREAGVVS